MGKKTVAEIIASFEKKKTVKDFIDDIMEMREANIPYKEIIVYLADRKVIAKEKSLITTVSNRKKALLEEAKAIKKVSILKAEIIDNDTQTTKEIKNSKNPFFFNGAVYETLEEKIEARTDDSRKFLEDKSFEPKKKYLDENGILIERKIILVTISTRGGSGKTIIANAWLVAILKAIHPINNIKLVEVDEHAENYLNYKNSRSVSDYTLIKLGSAEEEIIEILTDIVSQEESNVCIDGGSGSGNDTITLLKLINKMELKKKAKIVYVIPFNPSSAEMRNVEKLVKSGLLEDNTVLCACNRVTNMIEYKDEFVDFFGNDINEEKYIEGIATKLKVKDEDVILVPYSKYYETALQEGMNILDFSQIALHSNLTDYVESAVKKEQAKKVKDGGEPLNEEKIQLVRSKAAYRHKHSLYVSQFINQHLPKMLDTFMNKIKK